MPDNFKPKDPDFVTKVTSSFARQKVMQTIGATIESVNPGEVTLRLPYDESLTQQHGFIHAGIIATLLDSACGYAAFSLMPKDAAVLSVEFKTNLMAPAKGDYFLAKAIVVKPGRTITVTNAELFAYSDGKEKLVASMTGTMMVVYDRDGIEQ